MVNQFGEETGEGGSTSYAFEVMLSGTSRVLIIEQQIGVFHVQVAGMGSGHPTLSCDISKKSSGDVMTIKNVMADPAADGCTLGIEWSAGSSVYITKSMATHNAIYTIAVIGTA